MDEDLNVKLLEILSKFGDEFDHSWAAIDETISKIHEAYREAGYMTGHEFYDRLMQEVSFIKMGSSYCVPAEDLNKVAKELRGENGQKAES